MLTLVLLLSLLWAALAHAQDQPITNGSFETVGPTGVPVDWSFLGGVTVSDEKAHSGERSLRLERPRGHVGEVGINRAWDPASGGQGSMLAQTKGAIRFWYTVEPTDAAADLGPEDGLTVQIIPMTIQSLERANMRVVYFIPPAHVGDGQWRQGAFAYDFSAAPDVQWVHVSARILSPGYALFLDDFEWVEQVGPVLQPARFALEEAPGEEGERAVVTLTLGNIGDAASAPTEAALLLPPTLAAEAPVAAVPPIEPGDTLEIAWEVVGPRDQAGQILGAEVATEAATWVRQGDWKLIRFYDNSPEFPNAWELYNLRDDIGETHNLAPEMPHRVRAMDALIDRHLMETAALVPRPNHAWSPAARREIAGWTGSGHVALLDVPHVLRLDSRGGDPFVMTSDVPAVEGDLVARFRMRSTSQGPGQFFWADVGRNFGPAVRLDFTPVHDGEWHDYAVPFTPNGAIHRIRIDPSAAPGAIEFDWVRIESADGRVHREWDFER
jgi:hypothetical protein